MLMIAWLRRKKIPRRGDIWWARVPYARGRGSKLRPCVIVAGREDGIEVLKITSQDKSHRRDHLLIPTRRWDPHAKHDSYVNLGEPILVQRTAFQRRAGRAARFVRAKLPRAGGRRRGRL